MYGMLCNNVFFAGTITGVLYFVSCTVNPILYNLMSRRFRQAFVETICRRRETHDWHMPADVNHHPQMSGQHLTVGVTRRGHYAVATEMLPSQQQQQRQLVKGNVHVDDAGELTKPQ